MYELLCLFSSNLSPESIASLVKKIEEILFDFQASLVYKNDFGEKKLAYPIRHEKRGYYFAFGFKLKSDFIKKLEEKLKNISEILRYQIVKVRKWSEKPEKPEEIQKKPVQPEKVDLEKLDEKIEKILADENKLIK
ncbi:MAG: 30S ribosomal protein S6 [Patescibacteria group bacterium]|nr:30S ribosomal protein S6 [Patescibacteria group bacterium]